MGVMKQILTELQEENSCTLEEAAVMFSGGVQDAVLPCPYYDDCACPHVNDWRSCEKVWAEYMKEVETFGVEA